MTASSTHNTSHYLETKYGIVHTYMCPLVGLSGFTLSLLSFFVFSSSEFKEKLYKFLKAETMFMALNLLIQAWRPITYCDNLCEISTSIISKIYVKYFLIYLASIMEMCAFTCGILAALYCYMLVINKSQLVHFKFSSRLVIIIMIILSAILFSYQIFEFKIVALKIPSLDSSLLEKINNTILSTRTIYKVEFSQFHFEQKKVFIEIFAMFVRDGVGMFSLITINILLLIRLKKDMQAKKSILRRATVNNLTQVTICGQSNNSTNGGERKKSSLAIVKKLESKITIMIMLNCLNCLLGRLPIFIFFIAHNFIKNEYADELFNSLASLTVYLSYSFSFFLYYFNNKRFRNIFKKYFGQVLSMRRISVVTE
jgi:hypothetical protein